MRGCVRLDKEKNPKCIQGIDHKTNKNVVSLWKVQLTSLPELISSSCVPNVVKCPLLKMDSISSVSSKLRSYILRNTEYKKNIYKTN